MMIIVISSCSKEELVLEESIPVTSFEGVSLIDSLINKDNIILTLFDSFNNPYLNINFKFYSINYNYYQPHGISGEYTFTSLNNLNLQMDFNAWYYYKQDFSDFTNNNDLTIIEDSIRFYSSPYAWINALNLTSLQYHMTVPYQIDSVTTTPIIPNNYDSLFGKPSYARFYFD